MHQIKQIIIEGYTKEQQETAENGLISILKFSPLDGKSVGEILGERNSDTIKECEGGNLLREGKGMYHMLKVHC